MRKKLVSLACIFCCAACSATSVLQVPPVSSQPELGNMGQSMSFPGSQCADIEGTYLRVPIADLDVDLLTKAPNDETGLLYSHIPFRLADKTEVKAANAESLKSLFSIRQPNADNFFVSFSTQKFGVVEYHFRADEEDFSCEDGFIIFPLVKAYGMIEGMSVNYQIRNVIFRDNAGAFVIQETKGPYRGSPSTSAKKFKFRSFRYPNYDKFDK